MGHWYCHSFLLLFVLFLNVFPPRCNSSILQLSALVVFKNHLKSSFFLNHQMGLKNEMIVEVLGGGEISHDPHPGTWWCHTGLWAVLGECALIRGDGRLLASSRAWSTQLGPLVRMCVCMSLTSSWLHCWHLLVCKREGRTLFVTNSGSLELFLQFLKIFYTQNAI